jgi:probable phosphoglycerate mutase
MRTTTKGFPPVTTDFIATRNQQQPMRAYDLLRHPTQGTTTLYLVRHGQTEANVGRRLAGLTDVPLDALGLAQAAELGAHFANIPFDVLYSSPLTRAKQTAQAIADASGHRIIEVPGLSEVNFGLAENLTFEEALTQFPEIRPLADDLDDLDLGWPQGDTRRMFDERVMASYLGILERHVGQTVVAVAHGGVIGTFFAQIVGGNPRDFARYAVANCSVSRLVVTPDHTEVHLWNDVSHLTDVETTPWQMEVKESG